MTGPVKASHTHSLYYSQRTLRSAASQGLCRAKKLRVCQSLKPRSHVLDACFNVCSESFLRASFTRFLSAACLCGPHGALAAVAADGNGGDNVVGDGHCASSVLSLTYILCQSREG